MHHILYFATLCLTIKLVSSEVYVPQFQILTMLPQELSTQLSRDLRKVVSSWQQSENIIYTKLTANPDVQANSKSKLPANGGSLMLNGLNGGNSAGSSNNILSNLNSNLNTNLNSNQNNHLNSNNGLNNNQNSKLNSISKVDTIDVHHVDDENEVSGKLDKRQQAFLDDLNDHHQLNPFGNHDDQLPDLNHAVNQHAFDVDKHFNTESTQDMHIESTDHALDRALDHASGHSLDHLATETEPSNQPVYSNPNKVSEFNRSVLLSGRVQQRPSSARSDSKLNSRLNGRLDGKLNNKLNDRLNEKFDGKQIEYKSSNEKPLKFKDRKSNDRLPNRSDGRPISGNSLGNKLLSAKLSSPNFKSSPSNSSRSNRLSSGKQSKSTSRPFSSRMPNKNFNTNYDSSHPRSPSNQLPPGKHASAFPAASFASSFALSTNRTGKPANRTNFAQSNVIKLSKQPENNLNHINYEVFQNDAQPTSKPTSKPTNKLANTPSKSNGKRNETANSLPTSLPSSLVDMDTDSDYLGDTADQYDRLSETVIYAGPVNRFVSDNQTGLPSDDQQPPPSMMWTKLRLTRPNAENLMTIRPAEIPLFSSPIAIGHSLQNVLPTICDHVEIHNPSLILSLLDADRYQAASFISQTAFIPMLSFSGEYQTNPSSTHVSALLLVRLILIHLDFIDRNETIDIFVESSV